MPPFRTERLAISFTSSEGAFHGALAFSSVDKAVIARATRHEMTHTNDLTKQGHTIPEKYDLKSIFPKKPLIRNGKPAVKTNGTPVTIPDVDPKTNKIIIELKKAGVAEYDAIYAMNNPAELIAVASQGDMSLYSSEFKQMLVDFGMPEWELNMR